MAPREISSPSSLTVPTPASLPLHSSFVGHTRRGSEIHGGFAITLLVVPFSSAADSHLCFLRGGLRDGSGGSLQAVNRLPAFGP
ncbi:hypothetical protein L209DRAFT_750765 [Thermothelomyces heterothallicus CBS 203.75]